MGLALIARALRSTASRGAVAASGRAIAATWAEPGALLHLDAMQLPKFDAAGHWPTGRGYQRSRGAGRVYVVSVVDDHSRLAYSELHSGETGETVSATLRRAAA